MVYWKPKVQARQRKISLLWVIDECCAPRTVQNVRWEGNEIQI
jgi:hypothetical protein